MEMIIRTPNYYVFTALGVNLVGRAKRSSFSKSAVSHIGVCFTFVVYVFIGLHEIQWLSGVFDSSYAFF